LFDFIGHSLDPESASARYDSEFGYPQAITDQFIGITITEFTPGLPDRGARDAAAAELATHRQLWESAGIQDYTFTLRLEAFLPPENTGPFIVTARNSEVARAERPEGNTYLPMHLLTIERLFFAIERGLDADEINVQYDPELGYPIDIFIDLWRMATDEEQRYIVADFRSDEPLTTTSPTTMPPPVPLPLWMEFSDVDATLVRGPEHCGWHETSIIFMAYADLASHIDEDQKDLYDEAQAWGGKLAFVRDPAAIPEYRYAAESDLQASLPISAVKLTAGDDGYELWYAASDPTHIYLVFPVGVEAWALATEWFLCA
jgi:hypothetical protein